MSTLAGPNTRLMTPIRRAAGLSLILLIGGLASGVQTEGPLVRVLNVKKSTIAQEVGRLGEAGYDIALAHLAPGLLIAQKGSTAGGRSYLFVEDIEALFAGRQLEPGYRLLPQTLSVGGRHYSAIFEKDDADDQPRDYVFVKASSASDIEQKARALSLDDLVPVGIYDEGAAVVFERRPGGRDWKILATRRIRTMEEELGAAAAEGYRLVAAASAGLEFAYALVQPADAGPTEYRLLSTTTSETLERELNEAAEEGFRFVAGSLVSLAAGSPLFGGRMANEITGVVEKSSVETSSAPVRMTYRVVGARRLSTIEKEAAEIAAQGFTVVAASVGHEETVVVLAAPGEATTTVR